MDAIASSTDWPSRPYPGLRFYRERDALLFGEREVSILRCAETLERFGVKIVVLQGSSGAGKSSFLRAGLIPHLRHDHDDPCFFLGSGQQVVRSTADPLPRIASAVISALAPCADPLARCSAEAHDDIVKYVELSLAREIVGQLRPLINGPRETLAHMLVTALRKVSGQLPGPLVLVLDQVEEVLTLQREDPRSSDAASAFFFFLEEIYLRNVHFRIVLSMRTEYYGRFRVAFRISDSRLSDRPKEGGIETYLLEALRDRNALIRVLQAPSCARGEDEEPVYKFAFSPKVPAEIVDDLLESYPSGSVTPVLQVICSTLYDGLTAEKRLITGDDFRALGRVDGIMRSYVLEGVEEAAQLSNSTCDQWYELLYGLVSRQGGGTLVSLTESNESLKQRASELGVLCDIGPTLARLCSGRRPLLRGEPPEAPWNYSLQHDVLAVALLRWKVAHRAERAAQQAKQLASDAERVALDAKRSSKRHALFFVVCILLILFAATIQYCARSSDQLDAKSSLVHARNAVAIFSPQSNFRQSLTLLLANIRAIDTPDTLYERLATSQQGLLRASTLDALRKTIARTPSFTGTYRAAALDSGSGQMVLLGSDSRSIELLSLPTNLDYTTLVPATRLPLPEQKPDNPNAGLLPTVGFVKGLGPVAFIGGYLYYWNANGSIVATNLWSMLPETIRGAVFPRVDFEAGKLLVTAGTFLPGTVYGLDVVYVTAAEIVKGDPIARTTSLQNLSRNIFGPVFSDSQNAPDSYVFLRNRDERPSADFPDLVSRRYESQSWHGGPAPSTGLDMNVGRVLDSLGPSNINIDKVARGMGLQERSRYSVAFLERRDALVFKGDEPAIYLYDIPSLTSGLSPEARPIRIAVSTRADMSADGHSERDELRLVPAATPWSAPPFAGVYIGSHIRAAWAGKRGIWLVESSDSIPEKAEEALGLSGPLMSGESGGTKLQFSVNGEVLLLVQPTKDLKMPSAIMVWDLRRTRIDWVQKASLERLTDVACSQIIRTGNAEPFSGPEAALYQLNKWTSACKPS